MLILGGKERDLAQDGEIVIRVGVMRRDRYLSISPKDIKFDTSSFLMRTFKKLPGVPSY